MEKQCFQNQIGPIDNSLLEIIRSGEGVEPPADVRSAMEEEYNLDYGLGEKFRYLFQV